MVLYMVGASLGLVIGLVRGGHLGSLGHIRVQWPLTAFATVTALVAIRLGWAGEAGALLALALGVGVAVALANRHVAGMGVVAAGLCFNLVPVLLDGGTPVEPVGWRAPASGSPSLSPTQHPATPRTTVPVLSSRIPLPGGIAIVSFGDLVIAVGVAAAAANATRRPRRSGISAREVLAEGPLTFDLAIPGPDPAPDPVPAATAPGPIAVPTGWEPADDDAALLAAARLRPRVSLSHPSLRLLNR